MPLQNLASTGQSSLPLVLATGGVLVTFIGAQYGWERQQRRELRHSLARHRSSRLATAPARGSSAKDPPSAMSEGNMGNQPQDSFPAFGRFFLHHLGSYALVLLFVGLALWIRWLLEPSLHGRVPYGFFLVAVVAS